MEFDPNRVYSDLRVEDGFAPFLIESEKIEMI